MKILDLTAGNRAIWFDRKHRDALFVDIRPEMGPDIVADARELPLDIGAGFDLIVFDPPHENFSANGNMAKNYGHHTAAQIRDIVVRSAREAHRVSVPDALMAFKWNDRARKLDDILAMMPDWEPLFGHGVRPQQRRRSMTSWVMLRRRSSRESA